jgi:alanine racemase
MSRPTHIVIHLPALRNNLQRVKESTGVSQIMAVVKANGYGHGLVPVAKTLADQVDAFAVSCLEEAIELRENEMELPIILLEGIFESDELEALIQYQLQPVVHCVEQVEMFEHWQKSLDRANVLQVWMKIDTGMHRLGFDSMVVPNILNRLSNIDMISRVNLITHLANADDSSHSSIDEQFLAIESVLGAVSSKDIGDLSICNSAGILRLSDRCREWVRPGIMLYGVSPFLKGRARNHGLLPVMSFRSRIIAVNHRRAGDAIGYGSTWVCPESMPLGVVAAGYGDGYPRNVPTGTPILVNGVRVPLVGRVSMDMITVDLRQCPETKVGDSVLFWGDDENGNSLPVEEVAECAETIAYELLCKITSRVRIEWEKS